jgi:Bacterial PH domain
MRYEAKVDWWIGAALAVGMAIPLVVALALKNPWLCAISVADAILVFGFCWPQSYETAPDALVVSAGLTTRRRPYAGIVAVRPSTDSRSALALSLDRVLVESTSGDLLIAPRDQAAFFADVAAHCPQLSRRGMELVASLTGSA